MVLQLQKAFSFRTLKLGFREQVRGPAQVPARGNRVAAAAAALPDPRAAARPRPVTLV